MTVGSGPDFVDDGGLQIDEDGARDVFAGSGLAEKRVERVVASADGLIRGHLNKMAFKIGGLRKETTKETT